MKILWKIKRWKKYFFVLRIKQFSAQLWRIASIMAHKTHWISIVTWFLVDILEICQGNKRNFLSSPLHTCEKKEFAQFFFSRFIFALFACVFCYSWNLLSIELLIKTCVRKGRLMSVALIGIFIRILLFFNFKSPTTLSSFSLSLTLIPIIFSHFFRLSRHK